MTQLNIATLHEQILRSARVADVFYHQPFVFYKNTVNIRNTLRAKLFQHYHKTAVIYKETLPSEMTDRKKDTSVKQKGKKKTQDGVSKQNPVNADGKSASRAKSNDSIHTDEVIEIMIQDNIVSKQDCITCLQATDKYIVCGRCAHFECLPCSGMGEKFYDMLMDEVTGTRTHWFCKTCEVPAIKAVKTDKEIEVQCKQYMERFAKEYERELGFMKKDIDDLKKASNNHKKEATEELKKVKEEIAELKTIEANHKSSLENVKKEVLDEAVKEIQMRNERNLNLVFFNVEESNRDDANEVKQDDINKINDILAQVEVNTTLTNPTRLGKKEGSPRPLRVKATTESEVNKILGASRRLREIESFRNIYINKDRTPLEREEWRKLMDMKRQKNEEARKSGREENWIIRNNRVIQGRPKDH